MAVVHANGCKADLRGCGHFFTCLSLLVQDIYYVFAPYNLLNFTTFSYYVLGVPFAN